MEKDNMQTPEDKLRYYSGAIRRDMGNLLKWLLLAVVVGCIAGAFSTLFSFVLKAVTGYRKAHLWTFFLLPLFGICIAFLYEKFGKDDGGTNQVLSTVRSQDDVPWRSGPLIFISTALTHLAGGSAGREGAALQLGGSIGGTLGKWMKFDEYDRKIMIMCGMSAGFSALFGTPLTATVFAMEVISVGIIQYAALVPCAVASLTAHQVAILVGSGGETFILGTVPEFTLINAALVVILAVLCAAVSIFFCKVLHKTEHWYKEMIPNEWIRIVSGALLVILMAKVLGTTDYLGAGMDVVERAVMDGKVAASAFLLKIIFTAVTLGCGFRGGEIVPTLFVGATFGCLFGQITGLSPALAAACGMAAVFCGVTNCPISSMFLSFELFGFESMPFVLLTVAISYLESGYFGLYHSQKILYSKTKLKFINTHTKE